MQEDEYKKWLDENHIPDCGCRVFDDDDVDKMTICKSHSEQLRAEEEVRFREDCVSTGRQRVLDRFSVSKLLPKDKITYLDPYLKHARKFSPSRLVSV